MKQGWQRRLRERTTSIRTNKSPIQRVWPEPMVSASFEGHPFNDGNKRAGLLAIGLFLRLNGHDLPVEDVEAVETITALAAGSLTETKLVEWIRRRMARLRK